MIDGAVIDGPVIDAATVESLPDLDQFRGLGGYRRDQAYMAVEREVRRLHGLQAAMLVEVNRSCSFLDDFHHSATAWLQAVTNSSRGTAVRQTKRRITVLRDELGWHHFRPDGTEIAPRTNI